MLPAGSMTTCKEQRGNFLGQHYCQLATMQHMLMEHSRGLPSRAATSVLQFRRAPIHWGHLWHELPRSPPVLGGSPVDCQAFRQRVRGRLTQDLQTLQGLLTSSPAAP